jgi:hypothetical protein
MLGQRTQLKRLPSFRGWWAKHSVQHVFILWVALNHYPLLGGGWRGDEREEDEVGTGFDVPFGLAMTRKSRTSIRGVVLVQMVTMYS